MRKNILRNESGSMLLYAMAATFLVGIISAMIFSQAVDLERSLRQPRIKVGQSSIETSLRYLLLQPTAYTGCDSNTGGFSGCTLNAAQVNSLFEPIIGCVGPASCGVRVQAGWAFNGATRTFTGRISYDGTELNIQPRAVSIIVPSEVLTSSTVLCSDPTPIFAGFDNAGIKICQSIPNNGGCAPGSYMAGFDSNTLSPICQSIDSTARGCAATQYINGITWSSASTVSVTCANRPLPSSLWPVAF